MRKFLIAFLAMIVLSGCSDRNEEKPDETGITPAPTEEEVIVEVDEEKQEDAITPAVNDALADFIEYDLVAKHINLDDYKGIVESDNKGNRVILYEDQSGAKVYKSILVKNENRLKIIKLDDDRLLYNDLIK